MRSRFGKILKDAVYRNKNSFLRTMSSLPKMKISPTTGAAATSSLAFNIFQSNASDFEKSHTISYEKMSDKTLEQIDDKEMYTVGFARKEIAHFYHSAVVFLDEKGEYLVFGRQSPFFLKDEEEEKLPPRKPDSFLGMVNLFHSVTDTSIDNEKKYDFFHDSPFKAVMSTAVLSGAEIKEIITKADETICDNHLYNLVVSNCYSASVDVLVNAIEVVNKRKSILPLLTEQNNKTIFSLYELVQEAREDNFSIGVENNKVVEKALERADEIVKTRGLMELYNKKHPPKPENEDETLVQSVGF